MKRKHYIYFLVPLTLLVAWAAFYLPWLSQHRPGKKMSVERLPLAAFFWPDQKPEKASPELIELRRQTEESKAQLYARAVEELRVIHEWERRSNMPMVPPSEPSAATKEPNQPPDPTPQSGAGHL
jgi:hypothetical protein